MGGHETPSGDPEEDQREEAAIQGSVSNPPLDNTSSEAAEVAGRDADDEDEEQDETKGETNQPLEDDAPTPEPDMI